jgi:hypothetical protein
MSEFNSHAPITLTTINRWRIRRAKLGPHDMLAQISLRMRLSFAVQDKALTKLEAIYLNFINIIRTTHTLRQCQLLKSRFHRSWAVVGLKWIDCGLKRMLISRYQAVRMLRTLPDASKLGSKAQNRPSRQRRTSSRNVRRRLMTS